MTSTPFSYPRAPRILAALLFVVIGLSASKCLLAQAVEGQKTFSSPAAAVKALVDASRSGDPADLVPIIGHEAADIISSGDLGGAKQALADFVRAYEEKHTLSIEAQGYETLEVGQGAWPFPFPIVRDGQVWYFDIDRGKEEILDRRVGRNELRAIAVCEGYVQSQLEYASKKHGDDPIGTYARQFHSDPAKHDGLYWVSSKGEPRSPMGPLVAGAAEEESPKKSDGTPVPYSGYFYKILSAQGPDAPDGAKNYVVDGRLSGGFALIAFPAQYGSTGVMTFIVNKDGVVFQRDLGEHTDELAPRIVAYNPDNLWELAQR